MNEILKRMGYTAQEKRCKQCAHFRPNTHMSGRHDSEDDRCGLHNSTLGEVVVSPDGVCRFWKESESCGGVLGSISYKGEKT